MKTREFSESDLLDLIADRAGCSYLSDLHSVEFGGRVAGVCKDIPASSFPKSAWEAAARYILRTSEAYPSAQEAHDAIVGFSFVK